MSRSTLTCPLCCRRLAVCKCSVTKPAPAHCSGSINAKDFAHPSMLMSALLLDEIELPVWIETGKDRQRVTKENVNDVCRGMLLAINMGLNSTLSEPSS